MTQKDHPFIRIMHAPPPHPKKAKQKKRKRRKSGSLKIAQSSYYHSQLQMDYIVKYGRPRPGELFMVI